jgi:phage baseplate assembly protein V
MSRVRQLEREVADLHSLARRLLSRQAITDDRLDKMVRHGKVTDVDTQKQLARIEIGNKDGAVLKSPWVPYAQHAGTDGQGAGQGSYKFHNPPVVGQQMTLLSPNGEFRQAVIMPFTWYDKAASPSQATDEHVITYGKLKITQKQDHYTVAVDQVSLDMSADTATIKAATIVLDGAVKLGGADASRELALRDSVDSNGDKQVSNLSTKVTAV